MPRRRSSFERTSIVAVTLTEEEITEHALRIAQEHLEAIEYSNVYEDEELEYAHEDDCRAVRNKIYNLTVVEDS